MPRSSDEAVSILMVAAGQFLGHPGDTSGAACVREPKLGKLEGELCDAGLSMEYSEGVAQPSMAQPESFDVDVGRREGESS